MSPTCSAPQRPHEESHGLEENLFPSHLQERHFKESHDLENKSLFLDHLREKRPHEESRDLEENLFPGSPATYERDISRRATTLRRAPSLPPLWHHYH
jgi:hypothetical protein